MNAMEILLMSLGIIIFIISFLVPMGKKQTEQVVQGISEEQVKDLVAKEIETNKYRLDEIINETITYAMEKTERSMERLTNEKIMAVNEYSDTVLEDINKNHKEAVFLYDMLSDKHEKLKDAVSEAVKITSEIKQTGKDVVVAASDVHKAAISADTAQMDEEGFMFIQPERVDSHAGNIIDMRGMTTDEIPVVDFSNDENVTENRNNNERILELHDAGMSNMAIAKKLGLGIGEVKLVIDLF